MKRRKSYFANFSTNSLFTLMEQNQEELKNLEIELMQNQNQLLIERIKQVKLVLDVSKNVIIERYLEENLSLTKIAKLFLKSDGIRKIIYKELFILKVLDTEEIISFDVLEKAFDELELCDLMMVIRAKKNTIYQNLALKKYDEIIFDVEPDVYEEYVMKKRLDRKKEK